MKIRIDEIILFYFTYIHIPIFYLIEISICSGLPSSLFSVKSSLLHKYGKVLINEVNDIN